jgi:hypothetical protein
MLEKWGTVISSLVADLAFRTPRLPAGTAPSMPTRPEVDQMLRKVK